MSSSFSFNLISVFFFFFFLLEILNSEGILVDSSRVFDICLIEICCTFFVYLIHWSYKDIEDKFCEIYKSEKAQEPGGYNFLC